MATSKPAPEEVAQPESFPVTLDEFCTRLSTTDNRVEMIGAFNADEKRSNRVKDTESKYRERFGKFCKREVKD